MFEETETKLLGERIPKNTDLIYPLSILENPLENQIEVINETEGFSLKEINKEDFNIFDDLKVRCNKIEKILNNNKKTYYTELKSRR